MDTIDHVAAALARLPSMYRGGDTETTTQRALRALLGPVQTFEAAAIGVLDGLNIDTAVGFVLDILGKWVGRPRAGFGDDVYRRFIRAQIVANKSDGVNRDIIKVARAVVPEAEKILVQPVGIAASILRVEGVEFSPGAYATLNTGALDVPVSTNGAPWAATLAWKAAGTIGNGKQLKVRFDTGGPSVEVRDNESNPFGSGWVSDPGVVGVYVLADTGFPVTIGDIETAINGTSTLVRVAVADPTPTNEIDISALDTEVCTGTFSGGADGDGIDRPLVEMVLMATADGVRRLIGYGTAPPEEILRWSTAGRVWGAAKWSHITDKLEI